MVDNQVNVTKINIVNDAGTGQAGTEQTFQVIGDQSVYVNLQVDPTFDEINVSGAPIEKVYDVLIQTTGAATPITENMNVRSVRIGDNPPATPLLISSFFTNIAQEAGPRFLVVQRENQNGIVSYDCVYHYTGPGTGGATFDLTVATLEVLPGNFPTLPVTANGAVEMATVLREVKGLIRVYDVFILSVP